jgi:hypothetical protein
LLTYPDSSAAEHTPEKGEVEVRPSALPTCSCKTAPQRLNTSHAMLPCPTDGVGV